MSETYSYSHPLIHLLCTFTDGYLVSLRLANMQSDALFEPLPQSSALYQWLEGYLSGEKPSVLPKIKIAGTIFQRNVWKLIDKIPYGETRTYSQIATSLNSHPRAVGQACKANPVILLTPCHRVVGKNSMGGFSGDFGPIKKKLLELESQM